MNDSESLIRRRAARKGQHAGTSAALTVAATLGLFALGLHPLAWIALIGGSTLTGVQVYEWLRYRGEWGLRF